MTEFIQQPWPWYIAGVLIGLMVPALLILGNKQFGISGTLRHVCAALIPGKTGYFRYDWKKESWSLALALGIILGGFIATHFFKNPNPVDLSPQTIEDLTALGINDFSQLMPVELFNWKSLFSLKGILFVLLGGFLVGFGTRYANGCTSGHAIMGLSLLNMGSLVAVIGFFVGGLILTHFILPLLLH